MNDNSSEIIHFFKNYFDVFLGILAAIFINYLFFAIKRIRKQLPIAYNIAVLGFPKSGKTTLIVSLFGELFKRVYANITILLKGDETIERVNTQLALIEMGKALGPTTDQDLFSYRTDIGVKSLFFERIYKVQIGDFPGEDSEQFVNDYENWLHRTPYFKWAMEADAFIFVIDIAQVLTQKNNEYSATIKKSIRAAWQRLNEFHTEGKRSLSSKPVSIVFTKSDLLYTGKISDYLRSISESSEFNLEIFEKIYKLGFGNDLPNPQEIQEINYSAQNRIIQNFDDILNYLHSQSNNVTVNFVSPFTIHENQRLGFVKLLRNILPFIKDNETGIIRKELKRLQTRI